MSQYSQGLDRETFNISMVGILDALQSIRAMLEDMHRIATERERDGRST
jgi:hypothetical protein